jgi:DNA end-binding protein Ku
MPPRAMWKAMLALGELSVPVKLYAAAEDRDVHFRLLHAEDSAPVVQRMVHPISEEEIPAEAIRRGIEVERGLFVMLDPEDFAGLAPSPSRTIELLRFVPSDAIDAAWYQRPYFLGPDGDASDYAALREVLRAGELRGVARWTLRGRRYAGALEARGQHLALIALRSAEEVVPARALPEPEGKAASEAELRLAEQLVSALEGPFEPGLLRDEYRERLEAYLAARAQGRRFAKPREAVPKPSDDLSRALSRSLAALKKRRAA